MNTEINLQALIAEAANNQAQLFTRCMVLAGENTALKQRIADLESQLAELSAKLAPKD